MHAQNLLSVLDDLTPRAADRWVAAALAEAAALREHDERLYPQAGDSAGAAAAEQLRDAWRRWADDADALLGRLGQIGPPTSEITGVVALDYAVGRTRAMLSMGLELMQSRRAQADRGETYTSEEVRRELGLADRR